MAATVSKTEAKWKALLAGVQSVIPSTSSLMVNGISTTQAQMVSTLTSQIALFDSAAQAKSQASTAVAALHAGMPAGTAFVQQLIAAIKQLLGSTNPQLAQFGIALPKAKAVLTAGQKAVANAKRATTRAAHGILGKKQRAAIQPNAVPIQVTLGPDGKPVASSPAETPSPVVAAAVPAVAAPATVVAKS